MNQCVTPKFRVERGTIAEHWDTIETIAPRDTWQNTNGKFGFERS
jgi:predicted SnoaL-like aldol condensation-catalyzing enzyme